MELIAVIYFFPSSKPSDEDHTPLCGQFNINMNSQSLVTFTVYHRDRDSQDVDTGLIRTFRMVGKPSPLGSVICFIRENAFFSYGPMTSCSLIVFWKKGKAVTVLKVYRVNLLLFFFLSNPDSSLLFYYIFHFKDEFKEV